jgi:antitoxin YefM
MNVVTFSELRTNLKEVMNTSADQHEPVVIRRQTGEHMVIMSLRDYESLSETAYLLGTEANAAHLRKSISSARAGKSIHRQLLEE